MKKTKDMQGMHPLDELCTSIRQLVLEKEYETCKQMICQAMVRFPHAPQPHNLWGIVLEKMGNHPLAMKHFRAAWALDPTYLPAEHNLETYGTFISRGDCAFDESDLPSTQPSNFTIVYDERGVGRVIGKR